jgi:trimeric autotransporter adhesin
MKKIALLLFLFVSTVFYSQSRGISYQAIIYNPSGDIIPGVNNTNAPMPNKSICLQFSIIDENSLTEYQETITTTTDEFGMVNLVIGTGNKNGGYASSFATILWSVDVKSLKVALDISGQCANFVEISNQKFETTPFAFAANSAENVTGVVAIENGGTNAITVVGAKTNLELQNVDNTRDINKPISTATQTALNLKENVANKTVDLILDGGSDIKYPSAKAVKTYVDANSSAGIAVIAAELVRVSNAQSALTTNFNTEVSRAIGAESTKEDLVNKSSSILVDANSDIKYPTVKAVKTYIDANSSTSSSGLAAEVTRAIASENSITTNLIAETSRATTAEGTLAASLTSEVSRANTAEATLTTNLAAEVTRATTAEATKELLANKSTSVFLDGASDVKFASVKSVKTYVDASTASIATATNDEITRATSAENLNASNLVLETIRATNAENLKENTANKSTDGTMVSNSDIKFPTEKAVRTYVASSSSITSIRSVSDNYSVVMSDHTILCDNTNGPFTLTLPNVVTSLGKMFIICKVDDTTNLLTFNPPLRFSLGTSIFNLNHTKTFQVQSDGSSWFIIN